MLKVRKLEERASSMTSSLSLVRGSVESLAGQSDKVQAEVNRLKSHTQRSVDTSAGLRTNMIKVEGKLAAHLYRIRRQFIVLTNDNISES